MGSHPSKPKGSSRSPGSSPAPQPPMQSPTTARLSSPMANTESVLLMVAPSPAKSERLGSDNALHSTRSGASATETRSTGHLLQPVFVNGQLAARSIKAFQQEAVKSDSSDSDAELVSELSDAHEEELVDFLEEDTFDENGGPGSLSAAPASNPSVAVAEVAVASPVAPAVSPPAIPDAISPSAAAFGDEARDYMGVLAKVFEKARLTSQQQVRCS